MSLLYHNIFIYHYNIIYHSISLPTMIQKNVLSKLSRFPFIAYQGAKLNLDEVTSPCSVPNCASIFLHTSVCNFSASWNLRLRQVLTHNSYIDNRLLSWIQVTVGILHRGLPNCFELAARIDFPKVGWLSNKFHITNNPVLITRPKNNVCIVFFTILTILHLISPQVASIHPNSKYIVTPHRLFKPINATCNLWNIIGRWNFLDPTMTVGRVEMRPRTKKIHAYMYVHTSPVYITCFTLSSYMFKFNKHSKLCRPHFVFLTSSDNHRLKLSPKKVRQDSVPCACSSSSMQTLYNSMAAVL